MKALLFLGILFVVAACVPQSPRPTPPPTPPPEPPRVPSIDVEGFRGMLASAACADLVNDAFVIDERYVFWRREGMDCADNRYEHVLFDRTPSYVLCSRRDTIAGLREECQQERKGMFTTIVNNIEKEDLGLGRNRVRRL